MARNPETDYLHVFRFGVAFNGGVPMGFRKVEVIPEGGIGDGGSVRLTAAWTPLLISFLRTNETGTLDVSAFRFVQDPTKDPADLTFRLHGVRPVNHRLDPIEWDAQSNAILALTAQIDYDRLELIEGEIKLYGPNPRPVSRPRVRACSQVVM